ncbi:hypothetical protein M8J77_017223 [Diaphorina citri]|nr:hypothetical protein M8J77_017223 [Diaphorina citri]
MTCVPNMYSVGHATYISLGYGPYYDPFHPPSSPSTCQIRPAYARSDYHCPVTWISGSMMYRETLSVDDDDKSVKTRYLDTAYVIYRLWTKLRKKNALPNLTKVLQADDTHTNEVATNSNKSTPKIKQPPAAVSPPAIQKSQERKGSGAADSMDLSYVTERIIALLFPKDMARGVFRQGHQQAAQMLQSKHANNYMVFNLSERRRTTRSHHERVKELGWPADLAPPLERLCFICKEIDSWLSGDKQRIAVLHARGNKDRIGVVVSAYMHYSNICGTADQALDRFAMKRFLDDKIGDLDFPSYKRYVDYFSGLLSANIRINSAPLYLTHVTVLGAPSFDRCGGGCHAFLKIYEGLVCVYTSGVHGVGSEARQFTVNVAGERQRRGLQLRGDILLKCYHRHYPDRDSSASESPTRCSSPTSSSHYSPPQRQLIFQCQFHTCAISDYTLSFTRQQLDYACNDLRFPLDGAVELHFSGTPQSIRSTPAPTPAIQVDLSPDPVTRWDSYENLMDSPVHIDEDESDTDENEPDCPHTLGPLDGSLYATVKKSPTDSTGGERNSGGSGGAIAISSLHTVSMDSGISSAGNGLLNPATNTSSSTQPSPDSQQIDHHRALDELLNEMLLTVENIPDLKSETAPTTEPPMQYIDEETPPPGQKDIPYHARSDSQPFSYGSVPSDAMSGLSSPSLVRKASFSKSPTPSPRQNGVLSNGYGSPASKPNSPLRTKEPVRRSNSSHNVPTARSPDFHEGSIVSGATTLNQQSSNLTWLQRQQQKLRERREIQLRNERHPHETRLLSELRSVHQHHSKILRPSPSHRTDGYTSDTTLFADDEDFTIPLHININTSTTSKLSNGTSSPSPVLPNRTSSRKNFNAISTSSIQRQGSNYERSFANVKRSYDQQLTPGQHTTGRKYSDTNSSIEDACIFSQDPGLLFITEPDSKHDRDPLSSLIDSLHTPSTNRSVSAWSNVSTLQTRDESYSSWRAGGSSADETSPSHCGTPTPRPNTPAFPVQPRTPYTNPTTPTSTPAPTPATTGLPPKSPSAQRKDWSPLSESLQKEKENRGYESDNQYSPKSNQNGVMSGTSSPSLYYGTSRRSSIHSNGEPAQDVSMSNLNFVKDKSKFWYKPTISREEAIAMLRDRPPGTFVVRDSNSFPGAFGLALKVATPPAGATNKTNDPSNELVRHFLIEPTPRGVRLKGCSNEPVFSSLSALVYQHSVLPLALPCRLSLPDSEPSLPPDAVSPSITSAQLLLAQGAACNVLYLVSVDTESLTGPQAVTRAINSLFGTKPLPHAAVVHFKVSSQGITLTDNKRQLFFRRHYPVASISYCGLDPEDHRWSHRHETTGMPLSSNRCFGFVARKTASKPDNQCHIFAEYEPEQPATAIVNFVTKVMLNNNIAPKPPSI